MTNELTTPYVGEARDGAPCCVKHEHAGGQCEREAAMTVYDLNFCEPHGEQVAEGALSEAQHDAEVFLDQFRHPKIRALPVLVSRAIEAASDSVFAGGGRDFYEVLFRAFPSPTPEVRAMGEQAEAGDEPGYESFADTLIGSLECMHRLMRIAYEERETWVLELLEFERQSVAAQCAYVLRERHQERGGIRPAG